MSCLSMTGFGRSEIKEGSLTINCEIKILNHRFFESRFRAPSRFSGFEPQVKSRLKSSLNRGSCEVSIRTTSSDSEAAPNVAYDEGLAKFLGQKAKDLETSLGLEGKTAGGDILRLTGVLRPEEPLSDSDNDWQLLQKALDEAVKGVMIMKEKEGQELEKILESHLSIIEKQSNHILQRRDDLLKELSKKFSEKFQKLLDSMGDQKIEFDPDRILQEVALYTDRSDITEELNRITAHITAFREMLSAKPNHGKGRKLDFLIQELNREINTIGSKSQFSEISQTVVDLKSEVEKMREQVQNIE